MKKKVFFVSALIFCLFLSGCGKKDEKTVLKKMENKINKTSGYHIVGNLDIYNNEDTYKYDVDVSFQKEDKYRVSLKNKVNNHEQIILKNEEGVYVLTPSLNKSFKFQSDWPNNNSQAYLFQTVLKDIKNDNNREFKITDSGYEFKSKVNYTNNKNLDYQKVYLNPKYQITKVEVYDKNNQIKISMTFKDIDMKATYKDNYFALKENMKTSKDEVNEKTVGKLEDTTYPMYIPVNTSLSRQDKVSLENGERVIMTFSGEKPFMLIQEATSVDSNFTITPVNGEIEFLSDGLAALSDNSLSWYSNGVEYYLVSDVLNDEELISVANSISVLPVGK